MTDVVEVDGWQWCGEAPPPSSAVGVQTSAHGPVPIATLASSSVRLAEPIRRVAPGQSVVLYDGDQVLGGGIAT
jgi:tRNA-specific 2-thiouridylase